LGIFDDSDVQSISVLIDKMEQSSFDYLRREGDGIKIVIGKNGVSELTEAPAAASALAVETPQSPVPAEAKVETGSQENLTPPAVMEVEHDASVIVIKSPSYGIFYSQPEPGAPPFVQLHDAVKQGDTLGLVEIMKTFNAVAAAVDGEIVAIHVKNEEQLLPEQPLFSIKAS